MISIKITTICAIFQWAASAWCQTIPTQPPASAWLPTRMGLHIASAHSSRAYNNTNLGVYLSWQDTGGDGPILGTYYNSERRQSVYAVYTWAYRPTTTSAFSAAVSAGLVTGYLGRSATLLLVPSIATHLSTATSLLLTYAPKSDKRGAHALLLSTEWKF